jgi:hypothetical protein
MEEGVSGGGAHCGIHDFHPQALGLTAKQPGKYNLAVCTERGNRLDELLPHLFYDLNE